LIIAGLATGGIAAGDLLTAGSPRRAVPDAAERYGASHVQHASVLRFQAGFLWGVGTSAYQIEGAVHADGRGASIWDRFSHTPGKTKNGATGDVACDHYHRYEQDLDLMQHLGVQSYRFSIAWPRVLPTGSGRVNQQGLDFYRRLVEGLLRRGIRPLATLYHWDLPQALQDRGGWPARETALRFAAYAEVVVRALGDLVPAWITLNEPWVVANVGYRWGGHAPGLRSPQAAAQAGQHLLLAHGLAVQAFRALHPKNGQIGITLSLTPTYPAADMPQDWAAARLADGFVNRAYLDPVLRGSDPSDVRVVGEPHNTTYDRIPPGDLPVISTPIDSWA
jgi:beta-glucosidase